MLFLLVMNMSFNTTYERGSVFIRKDRDDVNSSLMNPSDTTAFESLCVARSLPGQNGSKTTGQAVIIS